MVEVGPRAAPPGVLELLQDGLESLPRLAGQTRAGWIDGTGTGSHLRIQAWRGASTEQRTTPSLPGRRVFLARALEALTDALQHPVDAPLGPADLRADLGGGVPLQAQLDHGPVALGQVAQQALDQLGKHGRLLRAGLVRGRLPGRPIAPRLGAGRLGVAAGGAEEAVDPAALAG